MQGRGGAPKAIATGVSSGSGTLAKARQGLQTKGSTWELLSEAVDTSRLSKEQ